MSTVRIHNTRSHVDTLGPGIRYAIWFQGCERRCKGCMAPESRPMEAGTLMDTSELAKEICKHEDIEGITVSGGEPFLQPEALCDLLREVKSNSALGTIIYTGYTLEELKKLGNTCINEVIESLADIIIDGEYIDELNDGGRLKGSSNQKVHFLSERYVPNKDIYDGTGRKAVVFGDENGLLMVGIPEKKMLYMWKNSIQEISNTSGTHSFKETIEMLK